MYTDTKETTRQGNGQTVCCGSRLYINIFWKQLFQLSISKFQQQKLNDETVTLPNLRILSMPIKKKKQYCARLHLIRIGRTHIGYQFWSLFVSTHDFFVGKKCDVRSHPSCNKTSHSWSVNGEKVRKRFPLRINYTWLLMAWKQCK